MDNREAVEIYTKYLGPWNTADMDERLKIANEVMTDDIEYLTKNHDLSNGRANVLQDMATFHKNFPGGHFEAGAAAAHHNVGVVTWVIVRADGKEAAPGPDFITVESGKITKITTFPPLEDLSR